MGGRHQRGRALHSGGPCSRYPSEVPKVEEVAWLLASTTGAAGWFCEARRIRSHYLRPARQQGPPSFGPPSRKKAGPLLTLSMPRLCDLADQTTLPPATTASAEAGDLPPKGFGTRTHGAPGAACCSQAVGSVSRPLHTILALVAFPWSHDYNLVLKSLGAGIAHPTRTLWERLVGAITAPRAKKGAPPWIVPWPET